MRNLPLQAPPPSHDPPLHLKHFNHLLLFHRSAPSPPQRWRNFDNSAFNFTPSHDPPLHLKHFNHLLLFHRSAPSPPQRRRNFDNSAFNNNNNNNNNNNRLLITFNNRLSSIHRSILSSLPSNFTFHNPHHPPCPSPQPHLPPTHHRALHQPRPLHRHQNQRQLNRNPLTSPFPSSHLRPPPKPRLPLWRHRPIDLLIVHFDLKPLHEWLSNGFGTDLTSPPWNIQASWCTSWTMCWRSLSI